MIIRIQNKKGNDIVITTSWDDGTIDDIRIVQLLLEYKLPGIFYIPAMVVMKTDIKQLAHIQNIYKHFEIGSHTITHPILTKIAKPDAWSEINDSKDILETKFGKPINSFCYPKGRYNEDVMRMVELAGYTSARTVDVLNTKMPDDPLATKPTIHVHPKRDEYNDMPWDFLAKQTINNVFDNGGYFHLWGHSWEIEKFEQWNELETIFKHLRTRIDAIK